MISALVVMAQIASRMSIEQLAELRLLVQTEMASCMSNKYFAELRQVLKEIEKYDAWKKADLELTRALMRHQQQSFEGEQNAIKPCIE